MSESGSIDDEQKGERDSLFSRSPSAGKVSGKPRWRASEPPEEIFGDGEWKYQIIGEEVDWQGNVLYEVEWEDWERDDHSNVTWETEDSIDVSRWKAEQQKKRNDLASKSLSMEVITTTDIHNTRTYLRKEAFEEKLNRYRKHPPPDPQKEMELLLNKHRDYLASFGITIPTEMSQPTTQGSSNTQGSSSSPFSLRTNQRARTRQQTENSLAGSSGSTPSRASSRFSSVSASVPPPLLASSSFASSSKTQLPIKSLTPKSSHSSSRNSQSSNSSQAPTSSLKGKGKEVYHPGSQSLSWNNPTNEASSSSTLSSPPIIANSPNTKSNNKRPLGRSDSEDSVSTLTLRRTPRKRVRRVVNSVSEDDDRLVSPSVSIDSLLDSLSSNSKNLNRRNELQQNWTHYAQQANAAPIHIVNDIDDEEVPDVGSSFHYLESSYRYSADVYKPPDEFLIFCSCRRCNKATICECQGPSELIDDGGTAVFAYQSGLFKFNVARGTEVIECNKFCECSTAPLNCPNRVSQKPRKHPIEVFKTPKCGWGVRSTQAVKRGQVLGIYTGLVITREHANALPEHVAQYRFDLDGDENGDQEGQVELNHPRYSVDSKSYGNWTRFINHSCSPNLQIYLVVHDTPPGVGLPYIVFVANQYIPPYTEFTFDYNPSKPMTSSQDSDRGERCQCGSKDCRGYY